MEDMNVILSLDKYSIYMNDNYYLCFPNGNNNFYHVFISFSTTNLTKLSNEELILEIRRISDSIYSIYNNVVYIIPIIEPSILEEVSSENDDRGYNKLLKKYIQPVTLSVYGKLISKNYYVSQIIKMIKQNDVDTKIVGWLSMKFGSEFVKEIVFENKIYDAEEVENDVKINTETISIEYQTDDIWLKKEEDKIADTLKPAVSPGFSALRFLIMTLSISLVLGGIIGYLILK